MWKSDGTEPGTVLVKDIYPGTIGPYPYSSSPNFLTDVDGTLFFIANDGPTGNELWRSDGTAAGTVLVKDIYPGPEGSRSVFLTDVDGTLAFRSDDGIHGDELWRSDGTEAGTVLVEDIWPGTIGPNPAGSAPGNLTDVNGTLFFRANDGTTGNELWAVSPGPALGPSATLRVNVAQAVGGEQVVGNLAAVLPDGPGFVTAYGCADGIPRDSNGNINRSDLNYNGGDVTSNRLVVQADTNGDICFYTLRATDLVIDVTGTLDGYGFDHQRTDTRAR